MSTLESILSGEGAPAPDPQATTTQPASPETTQEQPQGQPEPSSDDDLQADQDGKVSVKAVIAEREKGKRKYTEVVQDVDRRIDEVNRNWEQRFTQLQAMLQPRQAQPEPAPQPEIWDDPNAFVRSQAMEMVSPLQQQMLAMAREVAEVRYQPDVVKAAEEAFNRAAASGQIDPEIHRRINSSPNPYAAAVQWHQQTTAMSEIGSDPVAYKAKLAEEIRAQVMAELQAGTAPAGQSAAPVLPSNFTTARNVGTRTGPAWSGPTPIQDIFNRK